MEGSSRHIQTQHGSPPGKNQKLEDINQRTGAVILHLEDKIETQEKDRAADQLVADTANQKPDNLAPHQIRNSKLKQKWKHRKQQE